ncbi:MAG: TIGR00341 family protein [Candidatus Buchananbacteria bacterium]|nr:TIGR00341 family protein [Candidatus Buchananbacteria bacterium]
MPKIELLKLTSKQKRDTIEKLIESSSPTHAFFLILIVSAIITTFGILMNNVAIVIGGMIVTPLLSPILAISMGISMANPKLIARSLKVLGASILFVVAISVVISFFVINKELNDEIIARMFSNYMYFGVAVASGIAAAFTTSKDEFSERMVGVAVAIALLPPLVVIGIGISFWNLHVLSGSLELFLANLLGVLLGSLIVFSLLGFYPEKKAVQKELKEEAKELAEAKNGNNK